MTSEVQALAPCDYDVVIVGAGAVGIACGAVSHTTPTISYVTWRYSR